VSGLLYLKCTHCNNRFDPAQLQTYCRDCQAPLLAIYDVDLLSQRLDRDEVQRRPAGMWRWRELLPVVDAEHMLTLGEGDTPLLPLPLLGARLGLAHLYVKDESRNPTGTFKARGMAAAISKARELGVQKVIVPTAGNAGGALAAYAARGGLRARIYMPEDTPQANVVESRMTGADVIQVPGLISDAAARVWQDAMREDWFDVSTFKEPYRVEGKKVMGYELAEAGGWRLPDVVIYPTGGGTGLVGMWKAFAELEALGWLESAQRPRMVVVQSEGCAPVVKAFIEGAQECDFWHGADTFASGLRVPKSFADRLILQALRESGGTAVAVSDREILAAQILLAGTEGIYAAPEGAATLAGLIHLKEQGWLSAEERIIIFNTGMGIKYLDAKTPGNSGS
jgi:threonine synthase